MNINKFNLFAILAALFALLQWRSVGWSQWEGNSLPPLSTAEGGPKSAICLDLSNSKSVILVTVGSKVYSLPEAPVEAQVTSGSEFNTLTFEEKERFSKNRLKFLGIAADIFHSIRYLFVGLNWGVNGAQWTGNIAKKSWAKTQSLSKQSWNLTKKWFRCQSVEEANPGTEFTTPIEEEALPAVQTDLMGQALLALNTLFFQKARLVADSVEFGVVFGLGVSANIGIRTKTDDSRVLGGLSDLLISIGYREATQAYVFSVQSLNERPYRTDTRVSLVAGIDLKFGCYFKDDRDHAMVSGESSYPSNSVVGVSDYNGRLMAWAYANELNPVSFNEFFGYSTKGVAINLVHLEGSHLYPLFFNAQNRSLFGQLASGIFKAKAPVSAPDNPVVDTLMDCQKTLESQPPVSFMDIRTDIRSDGH